jgi:alkanesulfonate monooxygenase SsuD/methylene tetrahydromethanopterin reductase-like flavin-dependent oxidoreductase (luciferase family)
VRGGDRHHWKYAWFTEHHFLEEYSHISANEVLMPWVLARTTQMHVGSGIINVTPPVNHPARVAERVAMMDHVSGGRFEFGTGRGSSTTEMGGFGITDPELTREMYDEVIVEFKKMWADSTYEFSGKFFTMPTRTVLPKPYVKPHPPCGSRREPRDLEKAGRWVVCCASPAVRPRRWRRRSSRRTRRRSRTRRAGRRVRERQRRITTSFMCPTIATARDR